MPDKFPPKNSEFRFESFRFSSDVTDCRHAIYHHGCPSCDERDPEGNEVCAVCGEIYCPGCELAGVEEVMVPILRTWFGYDCAPHEVEHYAENAAVDLSWALQDAGLLASHFDALLARLDAAEAALVPEGLVTLHGERFTVEATGESETLNLGSHGEQIGHWYPVKSPLYRLVPYRPEDTKGAGYE